MKRPPHGATSGDEFEVYSTTVSAVTTAATLCTSAAPGRSSIPIPIGCFITWIADTDCYIRVGTAGVAAATSADYYMPAGVAFEWYHLSSTDTHFTVIQKTAGGTLKRYRSNL